MKRVLCILLAAAMIATLLAACGEKEETASDAKQEQTELVVFAAASMTETLSEIAELYKKVDPNVKLTFNFASSGTLKKQIAEGAVCDLFISAAPKQMNELDITADAEKNPHRLDYILSDTRINLLENKVTLCVPENNPKGITSFDDLPALFNEGNFLMAMGNQDVPVGQYTQKILAYYHVSEEDLAGAGCISYGSDVKAVTTQIVEGAADFGVIYATDAYSAGLKPVDTATEEMCGQVIYPAAVLKASKNADAAKAFLEYLKGAAASAVFEKVGFTPLS